jgi:17beta-estradiol 17-dehydrogenase / very-long-chain 3-oxoacyl-CoA reductase
MAVLLFQSLVPSIWILELVFELFAIFYFLKLLKLLYTNFVRPELKLLERYGEDSYVLITGATDGIGKGYAHSFARRGFNLILVSRTESKLLKVKDELLELSKNKIKIETIAYDFSKKALLKDYEQTFLPVFNKFDVGVLVNNVGYSHEDYFYRIEKNDEIHDYININIVSQTILTKLLMEKMNKRKNKSAIISMSSFAGEIPFPGNSIYSATKAYNDFLSRGLFGEYGYETGNIDFLSVKPMYVESNMSQMKADGFDCISVNQHVESVLKELGYTEETIGHVAHKLQAYVMKSVPEIVQRWLFKVAKEKEEKLQLRHQNKKKN